MRSEWQTQRAKSDAMAQQPGSAETGKMLVKFLGINVLLSS